ncbi:MAG: Ubiquitin thiolesterase [Lasallia pustulata]|uniref:ubiquitinyl hydrolase 1 n=1 Tax=Lasallia pustulata TaxID=136370 RepID=A0A5M8PIP9_9LECA|nr:MAG: Ubiquitin thiolesterase [Lasallia pustulata]
MSARDGIYDWTYKLPDHFLNPTRYEHPYIPTAVGTTLVYGLLSAAVIYQLLHYLDYYPILSIPELLWNILVYVTPVSLVSALDQSSGMDFTGEPEDESSGLASEGFAAKSDAMRRVLGLDGAGLLAQFGRARTLSGISTVLKGAANDNIPGLGNWDNSCYQNSVIQGLAALPSLSAFLDTAVSAGRRDHSRSTNYALKDIITKLNDPTNAGKKFWTPAELKNMSSWQQQDAQEYYSKVLDEIEKEVSQDVENKPVNSGLAESVNSVLERPDNGAQPKEVTAGPNPTRISKPLRSASKLSNLEPLPTEIASMFLKNPLEGLLAQRVGCMQCGFVEGLSLIPFNCLTVPLGKQWMYDIRSCLDDYTALEPINGVECAKCTLLRNKEQLERLIGRATAAPDAVRKAAETRLAAINSALEDKDFSENTLSKRCQIPAKNRLNTTKSRQAVVARAPKSLVIHVNRSVFNELTGVQSKNYADVRFPKQLDLAPWCLGSQPSKSSYRDEPEHWNVNPRESMLCDDEDLQSEGTFSEDSRMYELRAVITHYGRHENGHYICYRRHPYTLGNGGDMASTSRDKRWWRLSDDEVSEVDEDNVLDQGGVFMLFYESVEDVAPSRRSSRDYLHEGFSVSFGTDSLTPAEVQKAVGPSTSTSDTFLNESVSNHVAEAAEVAPLQVQRQPSADSPQARAIESDPSLTAPIIDTPSARVEHDLKMEGMAISESEMSALLKAGVGSEKPRVATAMRTARRRKGSGSVSRVGNGMTAVSSMVTAN